MKGKMVFGALLVSAALCSQGLGADLLGTLLGQKCGGCNACEACDPACEPACDPACEPACDTCCAPRCDLFAGLKGLFACKRRGCDPCAAEQECCAEPACCVPEPECCEPECCDPCCKPIGAELLGRIRCRLCGALDCLRPNRCNTACCEEACCEEACEPACEPECCEPDCCEPCCQPLGGKLLSKLRAAFQPCKSPCCEEACCEEACEPACDPACEPECCEPECGDPCCQPLGAKLLGKLRAAFQPCKSACCEEACCEEACCEEACEPACDPACEPECADPCCKPRRCTPLLDFVDNLLGCRRCAKPSCCEMASCGAGGVAEPAEAPAEEAAPLPVAPKADASAALLPADIYRVSRKMVRD